MNIKPIKTRVFKEGENLVTFIKQHIKDVSEKSVLVVTSKIVALSEGRSAPLDKDNKEKVVRAESDFAMRGKYTWLTIRNGEIMSSAGVDASNSNDKFLLLPKDSFDTAARLYNDLKKEWDLKNFSVLITDTRSFPLRLGARGLAIGYAGIKGIKDYRKQKDIFGRDFKVTRVDVPDSLAAAAVLDMGEGNEQTPLAIITDAPIEFTNKRIDPKELHVDINDDLYAPLFKHLLK